VTDLRESGFQDFRAAAEAMVSEIAGSLQRRVEETGSAVLAVGGGRTPRQVLPILASQPCDWARVTVTLTDDRRVAAVDPASNEGLARECLLRDAAAAAAFAGLNGMEAAHVPIPDVVYLGFGEDGHVASLFPGGPELDTAGKGIVPSRAPVPPHERVSMTMESLLAARLIVVLVAGAEKRVVYRRALAGGTASPLPLARVLNQDLCLVRVFLAGG